MVKVALSSLEGEVRLEVLVAKERTELNLWKTDLDFKMFLAIREVIVIRRVFLNVGWFSKCDQRCSPGK
jgi:hypothetical protein